MVLGVFLHFLFFDIFSVPWLYPKKNIFGESTVMSKKDSKFLEIIVSDNEREKSQSWEKNVIESSLFRLITNRLKFKGQLNGCDTDTIIRTKSDPKWQIIENTWFVLSRYLSILELAY